MTNTPGSAQPANTQPMSTSVSAATRPTSKTVLYVLAAVVAVFVLVPLLMTVIATLGAR
jgi:hypothetical protein